jgi:hypothetical protein
LDSDVFFVFVLMNLFFLFFAVHAEEESSYCAEALFPFGFGGWGDGAVDGVDGDLFYLFVVVG